jgi:uncharacterized membrane protein
LKEVLGIMEEKGANLRNLTTAALFAAIVCGATFAVRVPLPFTQSGYLNMGDVPIYLAGYLLGGPAAALAGAVGSSLADLLAGYAIYAIPTFIIKGLMGLVCGSVAFKRGFSRFLAGSAAGGAIMLAGYALFEAAFFSPAQALASVPFNGIQWAGGVAAACALYPALRRVKWREAA